MIRYIITSHLHLPGVRLSKCGHWGNIPYDTEEEARAQAKADAKSAPHSIDRQHIKLKLHVPQF